MPSRALRPETNIPNNASSKPVLQAATASRNAGSSASPVKVKADPEPEFKIAFQFVGSQDAKKATTENRSHVMRQFRRKQRWEQEHKKRVKSESEGSEDSKGATFTVSFQRTDGPSGKERKADRRAEAKKLVKRKHSDGEHSSREHATQADEGADEVDIRQNPVSSQMLTRFAGPQLYAPSTETAVLDVFTDRFVDAFAPRDNSAECGAATSIRSAATIRMFSPLLQNAFSAVSTTFVGQQIDDQQIVHAGHGLYCTVLKDLQTALTHPIYSKSEAVLATVVLLIAYESMRHTTPEALAKHCIGALQLIEHRGPHAHIHGVEHLCFTELRPYWAYAALVIRIPTFLSDRRWKTIPWSDPKSDKDIMQHLLDHIVDIPTHLAMHDRIKRAQQDPRTSSTFLAQQQEQFWLGLAEQEGRMRQWKHEYADMYPHGQPLHVSSQDGGPFPTFQCTDLRTGKTINPPSIAYPDPQLCRTLCTYYAALIVLSSIDTRPPHHPTARIQPMEAFGFACTICRSVEYFFKNVPGNMTNRMAFPLRAAHEALPVDGVERAFIKEVNERVEKRKVSKVFLAITEDTKVGGAKTVQSTA